MTKKYQILIVLGLILFAGFTTTSLVSYFTAHDSLARQIEENTLPLTGDNIYSEIQRDLLRPIFISSLMAQDTFLRDWVIAGEQDSTAIARYLKAIQQRYDTETSFFVSDRTRNYYHPQGVIKTVSKDDQQDGWYFRFKSGIAPYEINIDRDTADPSRITVFINYKVFDYDGNLIGVAGVGLSTSMVKQLIDDYQRRYNREIFFINRFGRVMMHSDTYSGTDQIRSSPELGLYATRILTSPSSAFSYEANGRTVFVNSRLVPEFNWYLIVQQASNPSSEKIYNTLVLNLIGSGVVTLVVLSLAWLTVSGFQRRLEALAHTDKLTGLANRQMLDQMLPQQVALARRRKEPLSCVIADLDGFKQINDTYGHPAGDLMISSIAELFTAVTREADLICRWGGDEFLFILPNCDQAQACRFAEKLRTAVENHRIRVDKALVGLSLSLGVSELGEQESPDDMILRADHALLASKSGGRNRVSEPDTALLVN
ncbi:sensor domain-containing diguanylate cyclase [Marinobacterium arenosum]|uniref:sensor domain-containing diguanylate cyclase n=1 Tax=Marinobacterium arenosum TaxID=2862496 RepID=UPI001C989F92|nr:sensor domain-containing diguanylate cyclase [Marinobacterium arenosum]MBY4676187.1 sensor domain-containing diguanylate cyclase [Marinobacterium arenosum]